MADNINRDKIERQINMGDGSTLIEQQHLHQALAQLPKLLTSPPFQSTIFIGREEELQAVHDRLFTPNNNFLMLVNGQGGIGKTTFASKYWEKYQSEYTHLAFLYVEGGIANAILSLAGMLGLKFSNETIEQQLDILITTVTNLTKPCLLILDNANHEKDLNANILLLRKCSNFHILLTSRLANSDYAEKYPLGTLSKEQALEVFKKHYPLLEESQKTLFAEIYDAVGGNTLVLELLAKNLSNFNNKLKKRYTLQNLKDDLQNGLTKLSQSKKVKIEYQAKGTGIRNETPEAIILAMYDLSDLTEAETALLSVLSVLPAENITFDTLITLLQDENLDTPLLSLAQKGWLDYNDEERSFKTSPVVQEITRHKNKDRLFEDCDKLMRVLDKELHPDNIRKENFKYLTVYSRYAESVVNAFAEPHNYFSILLERLGRFYGTIGNLSKALDFYVRANQIDKKLLTQNPQNPDYKNGLAVSYSKLGDTQSSLGNLKKALEYFEVMNKLFEDLYEAFPDNVSFKNGLTISYSKLGETQASLGNLQKALEYFEVMNKLSKELYKAFPDSVDFKNGLAWSYQFLGITHSSLGNLPKALEYFEEMNKLFEDLYEAFPDNVSFKNGLAISYQFLGKTQASLGNLSKALEYFEKDIKLSKELYEAFHDDMSFKNGLAWSYQFLGITHSSLGNLQKALEYFEAMNKLFEDLYEAFSDSVEFKNGLAISYYKLYEIYLKKNDESNAKKYIQIAVNMFEELKNDYPTYAQFTQFYSIAKDNLEALE
jgi:tetratricopeptide (TPR) repeat protein